MHSLIFQKLHLLWSTDHIEVGLSLSLLEISIMVNRSYLSWTESSLLEISIMVNRSYLRWTESIFVRSFFHYGHQIIYYGFLNPRTQFIFHHLQSRKLTEFTMTQESSILIAFTRSYNYFIRSYNHYWKIHFHCWSPSFSLLLNCRKEPKFNFLLNCSHWKLDC